MRPNDPDSYAGGGVNITGRARSWSRFQPKVSPMKVKCSESRKETAGVKLVAMSAKPRLGLIFGMYVLCMQL